MTDDNAGHPPRRTEEAAASLPRADGATIAYRRSAGAAPGVIFLPGFRSDMTGVKATALEAMCRAAGRAFLRFDYFGHGASSGAFVDGTIGRWTEDALAVLDELTAGPQVLVGSSMGGWIMLLVARARPDRVAGLVGLAAAPDFTEDLMWRHFSADVIATLTRDGIYQLPSAYDPEPTPVTLRLIEEARDHLLLDRPIPVHCPVRLIHGIKDPDVPWMTAPILAGKLLTADVTVKLIKEGDHRLSREQDIAILWDTLDTLCRQIAAKNRP